MALAVALTPAATSPLRAATVLQMTVEIEIRGDGSVAERNHLEVRLESATDRAAWTPFPIWFDERHELSGLHAWVRRPDGATENVGRQGFDTADVGGGEILHSSSKARLVHFPEAGAGAVLGVEYERTGQPYFPSGSVSLSSFDAATSRLSVRVRHAAMPAGAGWRWSIFGSKAGLEISDGPGELLITAVDLPRPARVEYAPDEVHQGPLLRYGWGEPPSWAAVGRWYDEVARGLPRRREEVRQQANRLLSTMGGEQRTPRQQLESILAFVRHEVRYVAVEVGVGGYRPAPPHETLARRWGDCKAKVTLLLDLLEEAGVEAYPALVRVEPEGRIDPDFPSPYWFNHMIAALPTTGLAVSADDPVAGGYLFVDPTQPRGGSGWLHPAVQDQMALVLRGDRSTLVRTPLRPRLETSQLAIDLTMGADGGATGRLRLDLRGRAAAAHAEELAAETPENVATDTRRLLAARLPGVTIAEARWQPEQDADVPTATLIAVVAFPSLVAIGAAIPEAGTAGAATGATPVLSLALAGPHLTPPPGLLRDRTLPVVLQPRVEQTTWRLVLPDGWCPPQTDSSGIENAAGIFHQTLSCAGGKLTVDRRTELRQRWIDPKQLPDLAALAKAEHRAAARRLRLDRLQAGHSNEAGTNPQPPNP